jgi:hypothetical protein
MDNKSAEGIVEQAALFKGKVKKVIIARTSIRGFYAIMNWEEGASEFDSSVNVIHDGR